MRLKAVVNYFPLVCISLFFFLSLNYYLALKLLPGYTTYDIKRIFEIGMLCLIALYIIFSKEQTERWLAAFRLIPAIARWALLGIMSCGLVSSYLAPMTMMALVELLTVLLLFVFAIFIAANFLYQPERYQRALLAILYLATLTFTAVFFVVLANHQWRLYGGFPGFVNIRFFSQFQVWLLPLLSLPLLQKSYHKAWWVIGGLLSGLWWMFVYASNAKGMWVALIITALLMLVMFRRRCIKWLSLQIILALFAGLVYFILVHWLPSLLAEPTAASTAATTAHSSYFSQTLTQSSEPRLYLWYQAIKLFMSHPLFGVGPLHYAYYPNQYAAHPHNSILLFLSEWGVIATLLLMICGIWAAFAWFKRFNIAAMARLDISKKYWILALTAALLAGLSYSLVSGVFVTPMSQVMFVVVAGIAFAKYHGKATSLSVKASWQSHCAFIGIVIVALVLQIGINAPIVKTLPQDELKWLAKSNFEATLMPRFWIQGRIGVD